jgi:purine-nucleoside phosphorylase
VLIFEGRLHYYEGHSWETVVRPVQIAHELGTRKLLLTNAAGGIADKLEPGSLMIIKNQIEWTWPRFWRELGSRTLDSLRASPYSSRLIRRLGRAARMMSVELHNGVYASVTGPSYETPAEIRALRWCGADAVGMSTAREAWAAHDLGMEVAGLSCITNRAAGLSGQPLSHQEVLEKSRTQTATLARLLARFTELL